MRKHPTPQTLLGELLAEDSVLWHGNSRPRVCWGRSCHGLLPPMTWCGGVTEADIFLRDVRLLSWRLRLEHFLRALLPPWGMRDQIPAHRLPQVRLASWSHSSPQLSWPPPYFLSQGISLLNSLLASASLITQPNTYSTALLSQAEGRSWGCNCPVFPMSPTHWLHLRGAAEPGRLGDAVSQKGTVREQPLGEHTGKVFSVTMFAASIMVWLSAQACK